MVARCELFKKGHNPHWIQAFHAIDDSNVESGIITVHPDHLELATEHDRTVVLYNHHLGRYADTEILSCSYSHRWGLVWLEPGCVEVLGGEQWVGRQALSVSREPIVECVDMKDTSRTRG